jgi:hypothetical protein
MSDNLDRNVLLKIHQKWAANTESKIPFALFLEQEKNKPEYHVEKIQFRSHEANYNISWAPGTNVIMDRS